MYWTAAGALRRADGALGLREHLADLVGERLARGRDLDAPLRAMEEREPQLLLELANLLAERRLRDAEPAGGASEVQLLRHGEEVAQVAELHAVGSIHYASQSLHVEVLDDGGAKVAT